ncbi:MAG TPA: WecB/TagA/CpsF family glycosyltransferase, partial [Acidimicrobiales bacterium]|nr:WecB/TagA/CpsF family glycosyltransferase [Acidimicrobiales bacterium]
MRIDVLGVPVDTLDLDGAADTVAGWVSSGRRGYVCVTGVHGVMEARRSPAVLAAHRQAGLVVPDGMPLVWCGRALRTPIGRVYGPDLMLRLLERGLDAGWRHAFYGASPDVLADLEAALTERFPGLKVAGSLAPPYRALTEAEGRAHAEALNAMAADVVWVGLSTPKQEQWMHRWVPSLEACAALGVGAAFLFHAGHVRQAPPAVQRAGLEWAYRLAREP